MVEWPDPAPGLIDLATLTAVVDFSHDQDPREVWQLRGDAAVQMELALTECRYRRDSSMRFGHSSVAAARILLHSQGRCTGCGYGIDLTGDDARDAVHIRTVDSPARDGPGGADPSGEWPRQLHRRAIPAQIVGYCQTFPPDWPGVLCERCVTRMHEGGYNTLLDFRFSQHPKCPRCGAERTQSALFGMPSTSRHSTLARHARMLQDPRRLDLHEVRTPMVTPTNDRFSFDDGPRAPAAPDAETATPGRRRRPYEYRPVAQRCELIADVIVEPVVDEKAADHRARSTLSAPAVDVNDSAGAHFVSDARQNPVVALLVDDAHVRNRIREVTDLSARLLGRHAQRLSIRIEAICRRRQIDDRVDPRVDEQAHLHRRLLRCCARPGTRRPAAAQALPTTHGGRHRAATADRHPSNRSAIARNDSCTWP